MTTTSDVPLDPAISPGRAILVTGATGRQGDAVARHLLANGWRVRALTRNPGQEAARSLALAGAELVVGDLDDEDSLRRAAEGVHGVYSVQNYWMHGFEREVAQGKRLADAALRAGVEHFVYSSAGGVGRVDGLNITHLDSKAIIERYIANIGLPYTIFRPVTFFENFVTPRFIQRVMDKGVLFTPIRDGMDFQMVALQDVGAFVALAFAHRERFLYQEMELASDFFTMSDFAAEIGRAAGRPVTYKQMSDLLLWTVTEYVERTGRTGHFGIGRPTYNQIRWNNASATGGWAADIGELRRLYPNLTTMPDWVASIDWHGLRAKL